MSGNLLKQPLRLSEEIDDLVDSIEDVEEQIDERVDEAIEIDPPETEEEQGRMATLDAEVDMLEDSLATLSGYREALERKQGEWEGDEFVVRELSASGVRITKDEAKKKAEKRDIDDWSNIYETEFLSRCVESTPVGAPEPSAIGDLPNRVFDWLLDRANSFNTVGEFSMGNSSLRERMKDRRGDDEEDEDSPGKAAPQKETVQQKST